MTTRKTKGAEVHGPVNLIEISALLESFLKKENALLSEHRVAEVSAMLDRKAALANLYYQQMEAASQNPLMFDDLDDDERADLRALIQRLDAMLADNTRLLRAGIESTERLIKAVYEAVSEHRPTVAAYGRDGARDALHAKGSLSVSLNTTL